MAALLAATPTQAATLTVLKQREHRQVRTLHANQSTLRFFRHHRWLTRGHTRPIALREIRRAAIWVRVIRRELAETRAALRPANPWPVPAWWLPGALCVHRLESTDWHIANGPYANGMQFTLSTWESVGGTAAGWRWASPAEQMYRSYLLWRSQGWAPWPNTSRACGLR